MIESIKKLFGIGSRVNYAEWHSLTHTIGKFSFLLQDYSNRLLFTASAVICNFFIKEKGYLLISYCFGGKILLIVCLFNRKCLNLPL